MSLVYNYYIIIVTYLREAMLLCVGKNKQDGGFTLVEISIVIIIIGLIVGGVIGGQSLIKSSERQDLIKKISMLNTAVKAFKLEYDAIPGDFREGDDYGLGVNGCGAAGNGDGILQDNNVATNVRLSGEIGNFFIYLYNAEILTDIEYRNSGSNNCSSFAQKPGITFPAPAIGRSIVALYSDGGYYWAIGMVRGIYNLISAAYSQGNLLSPIDAAYLDKKLDDAHPLRGNIKVFHSYDNVNTGLGSNYGSLGHSTVVDAANRCVHNSAYNKALGSSLVCQLSVKFQ